MQEDAEMKNEPLHIDSMEVIAERLSELENLYFPRALESSASTSADRKSLLLDLLRRDAAVFLERYGTLLKFEELKEFDVMKDDYEINWHVNHLRSLMSPTAEELRSRSTKIKNRRRAFMDKLMGEGQYFSEDSMREREPYLHHEYLGKFQDPTGRSMARPGERWSETLMRRTEEAVLVEKIRREQQRLGVARSDWVGNEREPQQEEEEEEEEDEDVDDGVNPSERLSTRRFGDFVDDTQANNATSRFGDFGDDTQSKNTTRRPGAFSDDDTQSNNTNRTEVENISAEEMEDRMDQFTHIMQQKFLSGEDGQHLDYSKIDDDDTLDDHWLREASRDAEEKYFDDA